MSAGPATLREASPQPGARGGGQAVTGLPATAQTRADASTIPLEEQGLRGSWTRATAHREPRLGLTGLAEP